MKKNPAFDAYIARAPDYARPILERFRRLMHQACPEIEENIKWGHLSFDYRGIVVGVAAFKHYVGWGFWKAKLMSDPHRLFQNECAGSRNGWNVSDVAELPGDDILLAYIREAVALNKQGVKMARPKPAGRKKELKVPDDLLAALRKNKKALATFEAFSPSHRKEYIQWIIEAKQEATRQKRLATAVEWLAEGKSRNWKYERKKG
jgi:uncharacterized protein YdeI (YjbR/CyaY-like superfamily)